MPVFLLVKCKDRYFLKITPTNKKNKLKTTENKLQKQILFIPCLCIKKKTPCKLRTYKELSIISRTRSGT